MPNNIATCISLSPVPFKRPGKFYKALKLGTIAENRPEAVVAGPVLPAKTLLWLDEAGSRKGRGGTTRDKDSDAHLYERLKVKPGAGPPQDTGGPVRWLQGRQACR